MTEEEKDIIVLSDETGAEHRFEIIDMLEIDEEQYAILLPDEVDAEEAMILKVGEDEEGDTFLFAIGDQDEWDMVATAWQETISEETQ